MTNFLANFRQRKSFKYFIITLIAYFLQKILQFSNVYSFLPPTLQVIFTILIIALQVLIVYYFILVLLWVKKKLFWKIRNRLIISQIFISFVPIILILSLSLIAFLLITYQIASYQINNYLVLKTKEYHEKCKNEFDSLFRKAPLSQSEFTDNLVQLKQNLEQEYSPLFILTVDHSNNTQSFFLITDDSAKPLTEPFPFEQLPEKYEMLYSRYLTIIIKQHTNFSNIQWGLPDVYFISHKKYNNTDLYMLFPVTKSYTEQVMPALGYSLAQEYYVGSAKVTPKQLDMDFDNPKHSELSVSPKNKFPVLILLKTLSPSSKSNDYHAIVLNLDYINTAKNMFYGKSYVSIIGQGLLNGLYAIAIVFIIVELVSLAIGLKMTRSITRAVDLLHRGTNKIQSGDLNARIDISSEDQLSELGDSFNSMTTSIRELLVEKASKEAMEKELEIARDVQKYLFPKEQITFPGMEITNQHIAARMVSGDYYDFFPLENTLLMAIGDVSGKGISAGLIMANTQAILRSHYLQAINNGRQLNLPGLVKTINNHLLRYSSPNRYITMNLSIIEPSSRKLTYCNAGHPSPLIIKSDGSYDKLTSTSTVLGAFEDITFSTRVITLTKNDLLLFYTDGLTEAYNENYEEYGEERILNFLTKNRNLPLSDIVNALLEDIQYHSRTGLTDDIAIVAMKIQ